MQRKEVERKLSANGRSGCSKAISTFTKKMKYDNKGTRKVFLKYSSNREIQPTIN